MKKLNQVFVVVKILAGGEFEFFQDFVALDKFSALAKSNRLNLKESLMAKRYAERNKVPHIPLVYYEAMDLKSALNKYRDLVADAHTEQDESY